MSCAAEVDAQRVYAWRVWDELTKSYNIRGDRPSGCEFRDSWGNRIQVIDLHDESLIHPFKVTRQIRKLSICLEVIGLSRGRQFLIANE